MALFATSKCIRLPPFSVPLSAKIPYSNPVILWKAASTAQIDYLYFFGD
jgi:hypothetical protein